VYGWLYGAHLYDLAYLDRKDTWVVERREQGGLHKRGIKENFVIE
jgi:hypothetical protein